MLYKKRCIIWLLLILSTVNVPAQSGKYLLPDRITADLTKLLGRPGVTPQPSFQTIENDSVFVERGYIYTEKDERVPILIYKPVTGAANFPAVIFLHGTGGKKDDPGIKQMLYDLTKKGIMGIAIDARFHGARITGGAHGSKEYVSAVTKAWQNKDTSHQTHPFFFDTVYDLWRVMDYIISRKDVQPNRIGMGGISMGGIETWLAASVDKRVKVVVLDIAVQSFQWSLANDQWQGRAHTIQDAHLQAAKDMGDKELNKINVKALWDKLIPGITDEFDCPSMIRLLAPRPLLVLSTENDQNCPLPGAKIAYASAVAAYLGKYATNKLQMDIAPNLPHRTTPEHERMTIEWFAKWL